MRLHNAYFAPMSEVQPRTCIVPSPLPFHINIASREVYLWLILQGHFARAQGHAATKNLDT